MDAETAEAVDTLRSDIQDVRRDMDVVTGSLRADIKDVRRHMDVVTESLRDDIRMVAEGVVSLAAKVDTLAR